MGEFIVSARKYRPATFASVVGQSAITTTLKNAVLNDQVAQAFLFCGPRGVGKTTCARILAKTINCTNRTQDGEACNQCESCQSFNNSASFNIFELDAASNNSVEDIRNLTEQVRIPPQGAKYKVYIIDEVHMLSSAAFNAFLKTLEEPPAYAKFILATTEKHKIIPTILSRCQVFDFKRILLEDIVQHLAYVAKQENVSYEESALRVIAQKADGGLRDALSIFDQETLYTSNNLTYEKVTENLNVLDLKHFIAMTDLLYKGDIAQALVKYNDIMDKGFDGQHFLEGICNHLRNLMVCRSPISIKLLDLGEQMSQLYTEQVKNIDPVFLLNCLDIFSRCSNSYKTSNNKRLHVEVSLMMICKNRVQTAPTQTKPVARQEVKADSKPVPANTTAQANNGTGQAANTTAQANNGTGQAANTTAPANNGTGQAANTTAQANNGTGQAANTTAQANNGTGQAANTTAPANNGTGQAANTTAPARNSAETSHAASTKTTSIKDLMNSITDSPQTEKKKVDASIQTITEDKENAMSLDDATLYCNVNWNKLLEEYGNNNLAAISLLKEKENITFQDRKIIIKVANIVAQKSIQEIIKDLLNGIWDKTGIRFDANFKVDENTISSPILDPDEKFAKLAEKNSSLKKFKEEFKLTVK